MNRTHKVRTNYLSASSRRGNVDSCCLYARVDPAIPEEQQHNLEGALALMSLGLEPEPLYSQLEQEHVILMKEIRRMLASQRDFESRLQSQQLQIQKEKEAREILESKFQTEEKTRKALEAEVSLHKARLDAHREAIDTVAGMTSDVACYVVSHVLIFTSPLFILLINTLTFCSQDSVWMNRVRRRSLIENMQQVLGMALNPQLALSPRPGAFILSWRDKLFKQANINPKDGADIDAVDKKRLDAAHRVLSDLKKNTDHAAWIDKLKKDNLAMRWISETTHKFKDLGNDAAHPKLSAKVWTEVVEHMHYEEEIDDTEKTSFLTLVEATDTLSRSLSQSTNPKS